MAKLTLNDLSSLANQTSAIAQINLNNTATETALENTLSRDGTSPNAMGATLDMNSNRIINLPAPSSSHEPARLVDITTGLQLAGTNLVVPGSTTNNALVRWSSTTGASVANGPGTSLDNSGNLTVANLTPTGAAKFKLYPWADVTAYFAQYGGDNNGTTDCSAAFNAAIAAVQTTPSLGGTIYVPAGFFKLVTGITIPTGVCMRGAGMVNTWLWSPFNDIAVVTTAGGYCCISDLAIAGKGYNSDPGVFGASESPLVVGSALGYYGNLRVVGGRYCIDIRTEGGDNEFENVRPGFAYGEALVISRAANWFIRCAFDQTGSVNVTNSKPFPAWAATTAYTLGTVVSTAGYYIQVVTAGTSGGVAPTLKNYGVNMTDGSVVWQLMCSTTHIGFFQSDTGASVGSLENHYSQCDFSGAAFSASYQSNEVGSIYTTITDSVLTDPVVISAGNSGGTIICHGNEFSGATLGTAFGGRAIFIGNGAPTAANVYDIGANVSNFIISNNFTNGGSISVAAGTSNNYIIANNPNTTVTDNGTGTNKLVHSDSIFQTTTSLKSSHATRGIGYATGAGGAVTQATNKATTVVLNKVCGAITMNGAALADATTVSFALTNSAIAATDNVIVNHSSAGTAGAYLVSANAVSAGQCNISVRNVSGGSLSEAIVLNFIVIKGVAA